MFDEVNGSDLIEGPVRDRGQIGGIAHEETNIVDVCERGMLLCASDGRRRRIHTDNFANQLRQA